MRYTEKYLTFDPMDDTSIGWRVDCNSKRARITKRSRWKNSRNNIIVTCKLDHILNKFNVFELTEKLERAFASGVLSLRKGDHAWGFTIQNIGHIVK